MSSFTTDKMIEGYFFATRKAVKTLIQEELWGHTLIIIYSAIDTCGLLDAPPSELSAKGSSFKAWVKKYMLNQPRIEFNEIDLWAARCSVLHAFTSESDLSRQGKARELHYYTGDPSQKYVQQQISFIKNHEGGKHLPVHYGDLCDAFYKGITAFIPDLYANCTSNHAYNDRLRKILQAYPYGSDL